MGITTTTDVRTKPGGIGSKGTPGNGGPRGPGPDGPKDWPPGFSREDAIEPSKYRIGMWVGIGSILMLFFALTSAYIVRQLPPEQSAGSRDWVWVEMPFVLWLSTAVLIVSSLTIELAHRSLKRNDYGRLKRWMLGTSLLGTGFLIGQVLAWRQLAAQGIYVSSNPHSSFFYLLTSLHGVHLLGGLIALLYMTVTAFKMRIGMKQRYAVGITVLYWHFMDVLWVYLFILLFFWR